MDSGVSLSTLLDFLVLCEASGYIEYKLPFDQIQENIKSLWDTVGTSSNSQPKSELQAKAVSDTPVSEARPSTPEIQISLTRDESVSLSEVSLDLLTIKTPDIASTPQPAGYQKTFASPSLVHDEGSISPADDSVCVIESRESDVIDKQKACSFTSGECDLNVSKCDGDLSREVVGDDGCDRLSHLPVFDLEGKDGTSDLNESEASHNDYNEQHSTSVHCDDGDCVGSCDGGLKEEEEVLLNGARFQESCDNHVTISDSSDDDSDDKLERLFSDMKIKSEKKSAPKHIPSRKSLSVFIVSDSEEIDSDEDVPKENETPLSPEITHSTPPTYSTPHTPYTGVVFWGSPEDSCTSTHTRTCITTPDNHHNPPLKEHNFFTPLDKIKLSKRVSVTTKSSGKPFSRHKNTMIQELYTLFNSTVFDNKLPSDMEISWNKKLRTTAGFCYYLGFGSERYTKIELSTKVIDCYGRVRDTLLHEMCHAATWIIDGVKNAGHGPVWRAWADKAQSVHPGLKPVERCHHYEIQYKHTYKCTVCDFRIGRHSKSVNLRTARCPYCLSTLELLPKMKPDGTPMVERKANKYAQFVKDHYSDVKRGSPWRSHKQVMEKLRDMYYSKHNSAEVGGAR